MAACSTVFEAFILPGTAAVFVVSIRAGKACKGLLLRGGVREGGGGGAVGGKVETGIKGPEGGPACARG